MYIQYFVVFVNYLFRHSWVGFAQRTLSLSEEKWFGRTAEPKPCHTLENKVWILIYHIQHISIHFNHYILFVYWIGICLIKIFSKSEKIQVFQYQIDCFNAQFHWKKNYGMSSIETIGLKDNSHFLNLSQCTFILMKTTEKSKQKICNPKS